MEGGENSEGDIVPVVTSKVCNRAPLAEAGEEEQLLDMPPSLTTADAGVDKDMMCPICMQIMKDAFLAVCGHSFCYMCIVTHLRVKRDCPRCSIYLTTNHLYPNFILNKKSASEIAKRSTLMEQLSQAIQQGCDVSAEELESLLPLLMDKKRKMEQEKAESNLQIMLEFLQFLRKKKIEELNETK